MRQRIVFVFFLISTSFFSLKGYSSNPKEVKSTIPHPLSLSAIYKIIEKSERVYVINTTDKLDVPQSKYLEILFPLNSQPPMYLKRSPVWKRVEHFQFSKECNEQALKGFDLLKEKKNLESVEFFNRAIKAEQNCYLANIGRGHALYYMGKYQDSILDYEQAIKINPDDYQGFFYAANNLLQLEQYEKAYNYYIKALALNPNHQGTLNSLEQFKNKLNVEITSLKFSPRGFLRMTGERIEAYFPKEKPEWSAWVLSKSIWLGESSFRKEQLGFPEYQWSTVEETHSLNGLVSTYESLLKEKKIRRDLEVEKIGEILRAGFGNEFVLYFVGSRAAPFVTLYLPLAGVPRMEEFVSKYIVTKQKKI